MDNFYTWFGGFIDASLPAIVLGMFGNFARLMSGERLITFRYVIGSLWLACFTSIMVNSLCLEFRITGNYWAITVGLSGYSSRMVVEILEKRFLERVRGVGK